MANSVGRPRKQKSQAKERSRAKRRRFIERFKQEFFKVDPVYRIESLRLFDSHGIRTALRYLKFIQGAPIKTKTRNRY